MNNRCVVANIPARRRKVAGFTLLELMIVVVIIAILAAVAIPAYGRYAYRARRADGKDLIMRIANAQERFYTANNHYSALPIGGISVTSEKAYYKAAIKLSADRQSYTLTATPQNAQTGDACGNLAYTNTGVKTPLASNANANSNGPCW